LILANTLFLFSIAYLRFISNFTISDTSIGYLTSPGLVVIGQWIKMRSKYFSWRVLQKQTWIHSNQYPQFMRKTKNIANYLEEKKN